jgi:hypothetical protein
MSTKQPMFITRTVPAGTKIYQTMARACKYTGTRPCGIEPVSVDEGFTHGVAGWAALPSRENGVPIHWRAATATQVAA